MLLLNHIGVKVKGAPVVYCEHSQENFTCYKQAWLYQQTVDTLTDILTKSAWLYQQAVNTLTDHHARSGKTARCRYNTVQYYVVLHTAQQWLKKNTYRVSELTITKHTP